MSQFIFKVLNTAIHVSLARGNLRFVPNLVLSDFSFALCFSLVADPHELLFFQGDALSFKLQNLKFFLVFSSEFDKLCFAIFIQLA